MNTQGIIQYKDLETFHKGIQAIIENSTMTFEADADKLTITLSGNH